MSELKPFDKFMDALVHCDTVKVILTGCGESTFETKPIHEGICALANRRAQPAACEIAEYAEDCKDCGFCAQPANEPLTKEELREMDGEPVYIKYHTCGRWEIYQGFMHDHGLYGKTWLAYRRKPERSENDGQTI
jgi:hypothetical protein